LCFGDRVTVINAWVFQNGGSISQATLSQSYLVALTYKSVGSTQGGRGKSENKSL
jgi:hypothetical protein